MNLEKKLDLEKKIFEARSITEIRDIIFSVKDPVMQDVLYSIWAKMQYFMNKEVQAEIRRNGDLRKWEENFGR
jgi:predicted nucleotidyltransferase